MRVYWSVNSVEESEKDGVKVYPNPATANVRIEDIEVLGVQVFNGLGQCVKTSQGTNEISVAGLPEGVYLLRITDANGIVYTNKITIR